MTVLILNLHTNVKICICTFIQFMQFSLFWIIEITMQNVRIYGQQGKVLSALASFIH